MKNFETHYPTQGSAALSPRYEEMPVRQGIIIAFPGQGSRDGQDGALGAAHPSRPERPLHAKHGRCEALQSPSQSPAAHAAKGVRHATGRLMQIEFVSNVRHGSAQGVPFGRMSRWQAVMVGCAFSALAFAALFLGI